MSVTIIIIIIIIVVNIIITYKHFGIDNILQGQTK